MSEKHFVVQGATCKCKFSEDSSKTDKIKVKTHSKHFANDKEGSEKLIATTKELGQTLEKNTFGKCKKQPAGNSFLPCQAVITQWSGFYEKVTLTNQGKILLENSKATCPMGAPDCIEIVNHGQTAEPDEQNFKSTDPMVHNLINPMVDVREMYKKEAKNEGIKFNNEENLDDIYISKTDASVLINYGKSDGDIRMISKSDFDEFESISDFKVKNDQLKNSSMIVTIDDIQIQDKIQEIHRLTTDKEQQAYIVLDRTTAKIIAISGEEGIDGKTEIDYYTVGASKPMVEVNKVKYALLGQIHTHNLIKSEAKNPNQIGGPDRIQNEFGTSELDKQTAKNLDINIYALDSWNYSNKNAEVTIGRVTPNGKETKGVGKTHGKGEGKKTVNIGLECLNLRVGR
ncbi:DUF4280 domain-containing protein [Flavobacterium sp. HTF]|uniref:DUF4280 domain-containing protein n=1 Tax=Flavobacterium sp. HTF TaxID=2170732 RepID=UPI000D5D8B48|nr:DUF4280 domain-containing protein [Flavobacterium sp. HTF]PWB21943.1 hypothetical protein DCO46_18520 [Flavobacterium sp. HTF]